MVKLLIIADDFTGALDTGVQFSIGGAVTRVVVHKEYEIPNIGEDVQVLVIDAETRHLKSEEAYDTVYNIVKHACKIGIPYIYKKTDSALRGNIGSELTAVLEASGENVLHFVPALPKMNRITKGGTHYIEDIPVHKSVFGQDPFEPVTCSYIPELIAQQSEISVTVVERLGVLGEINEPTIAVYDVETDEMLRDIAVSLQNKNQLHIMAGCAGFATPLPKLLNMGGNKVRMPKYKNHFLVVCGSVNPISRDQLDFAEQQGFYRIRIAPEQSLLDGYFETEQGRKALEGWKKICLQERRCIVDANDLINQNNTLIYADAHQISIEEVRLKISKTMGWVLKELILAGVESTFLVTGGDTLLGFMNQINVYEVTPMGELSPGTVLSQFEMDGKQFNIISKSGGFGEESLLVELANYILEPKEGEIL